MTKKRAVGVIYFFVIIMTLLLRISSALDVYSAVGAKDSSAYFTLVVQLLIFGVMPIFSYYFLVLRRDNRGIKQLLSDFGFKKVSRINALLVLALAVCMIIVGDGVSYAWQTGLSLLGYTHTSSYTDYSSLAQLFKQLFLVAVLPAFFEELTHRGLIYAGYSDDPKKFVLISALFFSLMHQNIVQTGYTFVHGAIMALCMYYTGSIWPGIFMHFLNNAYAVFSEYVAQTGGAFNFMNVLTEWLNGTALGRITSIIFFLLAAALSALILWHIARNAQAKRGANYIEVASYSSAPAKARRAYFDAPFFATTAVGIAATVFTFVWGVMR